MRVLHVISGLSRNSGGPSRSVQGLVAGLNRWGVEAWLMTLNRGDAPWVDGIGRFLNGRPFEYAVLESQPDIVHLHGLWSLGLHRCAVICRRLGIRYVIAPRGMLEPWSLRQKWLKKRMARWLYQDRDLKCAAALHATAESEAEQFRRLGFRNAVIVSPNGVNVPKELVTGNRERGTVGCIRRVLFVSRMHSKKGVMELVEAWNALKLTTHNSQLTDWACELVYTTNSDYEREYETKVKARILELGMSYQDTDGTIHSSSTPSSTPTPSSTTPTPDFLFTGALDDEKKWDAYARADLFVLPTYSENFGIVVAEALWAGLPVITTKGTPWSELEVRRCGWWIDIGVEPLARALKEAMALTDTERREMGERGRKLVEEKYTWDAVVRPIIDCYERILA